MMTRNIERIWLSGCGGLLATLVFMAGCGAKVTVDGGGNGDGGSASGTGGSGGGTTLPPCADGKDVVLAMNSMLLGDADPNGAPNPTNGWKQYGFNLDGMISTKEATGLCKPIAGGSPAAVYPDGIDGIDNSFGKNILPILLGLSSDVSVQLNKSIAQGERTYLMSISDVGGEDCATQSTLFFGANLGHVPKFDGSDVWPIDATSLVNPNDPTNAKWEFPNTKVTQGVVLTGTPSSFDLHLYLSGLDLVLPVHRARIRFALGADQKSATGGQIGGVIAVADLTAEIQKSAAAFDASFCDPNSPTLQSILNQVRQAADILLDGTQDPSKPCEGISIGLGFTMKSAQLGPVAPPPPPPPNPCAP